MVKPVEFSRNRATLALLAAASIAVWATRAPAAFAAAPVMKPTSLVIRNLSDIGAITGDGAYVYEVNAGTRHSSATAWLVDMNGRKWRVPNLSGDGEGGVAPLLGTETGHDLFVFTQVSGSAPIAYAFQPGVGVIHSFMNHRDPFAQSMYDAIVSAQGHVAALRTNSPGGAGPSTYQWTDIDDTPVPMLAAAQAATWSPDGVDLGYFSSQLGSGQGWLGVYNVADHKVQLLGAPFQLAQFDPSATALQGWLSTGFYSGATSTARVQWSPSGHLLAAERQSPQSLLLYSLTSGKSDTIPIAQAGDFWGWTASGQVYVTDLNTVRVYYNHSNHWKSVLAFHTSSSIIRAVSTVHGLLIGTSDERVYLINKNAMIPAVPVRVKAWWFDTRNNLLYVLPTADKGRVYSVALN